VRDIRRVSFEVAVKIAGKIYELGLASTKRPRDIRRFIASTMYRPVYR